MSEKEKIAKMCADVMKAFDFEKAAALLTIKGKSINKFELMRHVEKLLYILKSHDDEPEYWWGTSHGIFIFYDRRIGLNIFLMSCRVCAHNYDYDDIDVKEND